MRDMKSTCAIHSVSQLLWYDENTCCGDAVWRPVLDQIDPGDGKLREAILLGDIFMAGPGPPNFPATMLVSVHPGFCIDCACRVMSCTRATR